MDTHSDTLNNLTAQHILPRAPLIPGWNTQPFPHLQLAAGGLLALADLRTIANRTAIKGGSSWADAFVLAPGLHYQQAADYLDREAPFDVFAMPLASAGGGQTRYIIKNRVMANYLIRLARSNPKGGVITLDVGTQSQDWGVAKRLREILKKNDKLAAEQEAYKNALHPALEWISNLLYIFAPILTISSMYLMILFDDKWGFSIVLALIIARLLNIWAIKNRTEPLVPPAPPAANQPITEYSIELGGGRIIRLRGLDSDLQALTTQAWLRSQTVIDGYLEAIAKLIVYVVAAISGNMTQAGTMTLMGLLLFTAALLGISNANAKGIRVHGRYAMLESDRWAGKRRGQAPRYRV